ncbi:MAG: hypothetical protein LBC43_01025 [Bifidobacteriaceae bacterium]|jgi:UDP-N-acetylmuramoylalanine--D-glutamate ligase|nr:hypothetical protein [Bifidobacteriaceae bacterium]
MSLEFQTAQTALVDYLLSKKVLVWGLGREGTSSAELLRQVKHPQWHSTQDNTEVLKIWSDYDLILKSPGISIHNIKTALPAAQRPNVTKLSRRLTSQSDLVLQFFHPFTIGVTGTKGKSTTVSLIHHVFNYCHTPNYLLGNIGVSPFSFLNNIKGLSSYSPVISGNDIVSSSPRKLSSLPRAEFIQWMNSAERSEGSRNLLDISSEAVYTEREKDLGLSRILILELSSFQLEFVHHSPHIAVQLGLESDHLDYHLNLQAYSEAKANIFRFQKSGDLAFRAKDINDALFVEREWLAESMPLLGEHNLINAAAAWLVCSELGVSQEQFAQALKSFTGLPHRLELVGIRNEVAYYNDSNATNPTATIAGIKALTETTVSHPLQTLIIGGADKHLDTQRLVEYINKLFEQQSDLRLILLPDTGWQLQDQLPAHNVYRVENLPAAVELTRKITQAGRAVLFSPASASFNQYRDYIERGEHFRKLVESIHESTDRRIPNFL